MNNILDNSHKPRTARLNKDLDWLRECIARPDEVDILVWRKVAGSFGQQALASLNSGKPNHRTRAAMLMRTDCTQLPKAIVDAVVSCVASLANCISMFEVARSKVGSVVMTGVVATTEELVSLHAELVAQNIALGEAVEDLAQVTAGRRVQASGEKKKASLKVAAFLKPLERGGTPASLARFFMAKGMLARPSGIAAAEWPAASGEFRESSLDLITPASAPSAPEGQGVWEKPWGFALPAAGWKGSQPSATAAASANSGSACAEGVSLGRWTGGSQQIP